MPTSRRSFPPPGETGRWHFALFGVALLVAASVYGLRPFISYKALRLGATTFEIGVIASAFAILATVASIPLGRLVDRTGERRIVMAGTLTVAVASVIVAIAPALLWLAVAQSALGLGQLMVAVGSHSILAYRGDAGRRDHRIGLYASAVSLGYAIGPWLAGFLADPAWAQDGEVLFSIGAVVAALCAGGIAFRLPAGLPHALPGRLPAAARASIRRTLGRRSMREALVASIAGLAAVDLLIAYLPVVGSERGLAPSVVGVMLGVQGISQLAVRLFMGRLVASLGHHRILLLSIAAPAVLVPVLAFVSNAAVLILVMAAIGLALGLAQPMTLALVARSAEPNGQGLAMGMRLAGNRMGELLIPVTVGATAGQLGASGILVAIGGILGVAAVYQASGRREAAGRPAGSPGESADP